MPDEPETVVRAVNLRTPASLVGVEPLADKRVLLVSAAGDVAIQAVLTPVDCLRLGRALVAAVMADGSQEFKLVALEAAGHG